MLCQNSITTTNFLFLYDNDVKHVYLNWHLIIYVRAFNFTLQIDVDVRNKRLKYKYLNLKKLFFACLTVLISSGKEPKKIILQTRAWYYKLQIQQILFFQCNVFGKIVNLIMPAMCIGLLTVHVTKANWMYITYLYRHKNLCMNILYIYIDMQVFVMYIKVKVI